MPKLRNKKYKTDESRITKTVSSDAEELINDFPDDFSSDMSGEFAFDPHDLTDKIMKFGAMLTGIDLYDYQYAPAYRVIYSVITLEGASITLLTSRQCVKKGSVIHNRDGSLCAIENHPNAWLTAKNRPVKKYTSYLGHEVFLTNNHPVHTRDGWKKAEDLKIGEEIACLVKWDKFPEKTTVDQRDTNIDFPSMVSKLSRKDCIDLLNNLYKKDSFFAPDRTVAETIQQVLNKFGFPSFIDKSVIDKLGNTGFYVKFPADFMNKTFEKFLRTGVCPTVPEYDFMGEDGEQYKFAPLLNITFDGFYDVYDVEVPEKHWFTCGGIKLHNCGKSEVVAFVVATLMVILPKLADIFEDDLGQFSTGFKSGLFAPQSEQVDNVYGRTKSRIGSHNAAMVMSDEDIDTGIISLARLKLTNDSICSAQTASKQSKIEGKTLDLAVIDETQEIDSLIAQKSIEPMVSATGGTILRCGTTGTSKNHFYEEIQFNKKADRAVDDKRLKTHYEYDYKSIIASRKKQYEVDGKKYHLLYQKDVMKKYHRWGKDSDAFKLSYALVWTFETGMFCTEKKFEALLNKKLKTESDPQEVVPISKFILPDGQETHIVFGIDWAKENNSTVLTIVEVYPSNELHESVEDYEADKPNKRLLNWYEFPSTSYEDQHIAIMDLIDLWMPTYVVCDSTGVGNAPTERLMFNAPPETQVVPYVFSRTSKSDMWQSLEEDMQKDRIVVPAYKSVRDSEEYKNFEKQLTSAVRFYVGGLLVVQKGPHSFDDYLDSLGLATLGANMDILVEDYVEQEEHNPFYPGAGMMESIRQNSYN